MKPPRDLQPHLDFYHGELYQAPRDLFEGREIGRAISEDAVIRVGDADQTELPASFRRYRALPLNERPRVARNSYCAPHVSIARGVSVHERGTWQR
jgi:hypothetical protein